jgi:hypothetical protein
MLPHRHEQLSSIDVVDQVVVKTVPEKQSSGANITFRLNPG